MFGKISHWRGTHLTEERKEFLKNLYKGKTIEDLYGEEKAKEIKEKISKKVKGKNLGQIRSNKTKMEISSSLKNYFKSNEAKRKTSETTKLAMQRPEVKEKIRLSHLKRKEQKIMKVEEDSVKESQM